MTSTFRDWFGDPPAKLAGQLELDASAEDPKEDRPLTVAEVVRLALHTNQKEGE